MNAKRFLTNAAPIRGHGRPARVWHCFRCDAQSPNGRDARSPCDVISRSPVAGFKFPVSVFLSLLLFPLCAPAATDSALFPDGRETIALRPGERNPFTQQVVQEAQTTAAPETASEESRLRRILRTIKISGVSGGNGKFQALLGSLILKPGNTLPPLINNQSEQLRVAAVDSRSLTLAFVERDPSADPRQIVLPIGIKPDVTQFLYGEAVEDLIKLDQKGQSTLPPIENPEVAKILKDSQDVDLNNMTDRGVKLMGVVHDVPQPKK